MINALRDSEAIVPGDIDSHKNVITLSRNPAFSDVFSAMDNLITYVNANMILQIFAD